MVSNIDICSSNVAGLDTSRSTGTKEETKKILEKMGFSFSSKENKKETDTDRRERIKETNANIQRVDNQVKR